jgi:hypothetical protein
MGFGGGQTFGVAIVQCGVVERADAAGGVVLLDGFDELRNLLLRVENAWYPVAGL